MQLVIEPRPGNLEYFGVPIRRKDLLRMVNSIHHVAIITCNYERSNEFYFEKLGFAIIAENYRSDRQSHKLDLAMPGGIQLELFSIAGRPEWPSYPEAKGHGHGILCGWSTATIAMLECKSIATDPVRIDPYTNKRFTFFADPDGLPIEVYEM